MTFTADLLASIASERAALGLSAWREAVRARIRWPGDGVLIVTADDGRTRVLTTTRGVTIETSSGKDDENE